MSGEPLSAPLTPLRKKENPGLTVQAFWLMAARMIGFVFTLALPFVLVRLFTREEFGAYKQAFIIAGTAQALLPFSFGISAFYFLARNPAKGREVIFNIVLYYGAIGAAALAVLAIWPGCLTLILGHNQLTGFSVVIGLIIFTWLFSSFLELVATANADVGYSTVFIISAQATKAVLLMGAAAIFRNVEAVLWAAVIQGAIQCCVLLWYLHLRFPGFWRHFDGKMAAEQFWYVVPLGISGLLYVVQTDLHTYLVANRFSTADYAIYAVGTTQIPLVGILRDSVNSVMLPRFSKLQQEQHTEEMLRLTLRTWRKLALAFLPLFAGMLVLGRDFITVLYRADYLDSWPIFALNLTLLLFSIFITDAVVRAHAEIQSLMLKIRVLVLIVQIIVSLLAMPVIGMAGALVGMIVAFALERLINLRIILRMLGFSRKDLPELASIAGFAAASVVSALVTLAAAWLMRGQPAFLRLIAGGAVYGSAYVASVVLMGLPDAEEKAFVNQYSSRFLRIALVK